MPVVGSQCEVVSINLICLTFETKQPFVAQGEGFVIYLMQALRHSITYYPNLLIHDSQLSGILVHGIQVLYIRQRTVKKQKPTLKLG